MHADCLSICIGLEIQREMVSVIRQTDKVHLHPIHYLGTGLSVGEDIFLAFPLGKILRTMSSLLQVSASTELSKLSAKKGIKYFFPHNFFLSPVPQQTLWHVLLFQTFQVCIQFSIVDDLMICANTLIHI